MSDLWERLRAAKARGEAAGPAPEPAEAEESLEPAPPGWTWITALVAERRHRFSLEPRFWDTVGRDIQAADWDQVLCFDTETTGLSGGAGTIAFLIGWARLLPQEGAQLPSVEIRQWFLRDHPGEHDLIAAIDGALASARALVSFNGASFDLPLLRSRWSLAGRSFPPRLHRDDLHPSRRLWRRILDNCRLSRIEEAVLGIRRLDDVPGALVPALWFDYLRRGAQADFLTPLEGVLRHHAQDVYSLLCLDLLLASMRRNPSALRWRTVSGPTTARNGILRPAPEGLLHPDLGPSTPVDFWGLLKLKTESEAETSLEEAWNAQEEEAVGLAWADRLKRRQDPRAAELWNTLWEGKRSYGALEELLKWLEHREKTPEARTRALGLIEEAFRAPFLPRAWKESLEKRRNRLSRFPSSAGP